jgi:hypothetical protein
LNSLAPSLNWYLIFLHIVGSAACLGLNLFATTRCATANEQHHHLLLHLEKPAQI